MMSLYVLKIYMMIWYYACNNDAHNDEIFMIKLLFWYSWLESSFLFANDKGREKVVNVLSWIDVKDNLKDKLATLHKSRKCKNLLTFLHI